MQKNQIKITEKLISIPPYLSTRWDNVTAICTKGSQIVFTLKDGESIAIPNLEDPLKDEIFSTHARIIDKEVNSAPSKSMDPRENPFTFKLFNPFGEEGTPDLFKGGMTPPEMGNLMQHSMEQSDAKDLPKELVEKIAGILKLVIPNDPEMMPKAEPHCNCPHCQIARVINKDEKPPVEEEPQEELVNDSDLNFQPYNIEPCGENLFHVSDKLSPTEVYTVFLGNPVGCTCGQEGCEHIVAVLKS